ncbi:MAG: toxin-antitoxin system YwqK family antitoxin [Janthinobacterium lividum]
MPSSDINSEHRNSVQAKWADSHILGYDCLCYGDGSVTLLSIYTAETGRYYAFPRADTTIEGIIKYNDDPWTEIQVYNSRVVRGDLTFVCGEGAMGNEGFVAATDANGLVWALFSTASNPFERLELVGTTLRAYSIYHLYSINLEKLTDIRIEKNPASFNYFDPYTTRKNIFDLVYCTQASGEDIICNPTGEPYTGVIYEALPSGSLTAQYEVKNGRKDGVSQEYYSAGYLECLSHYQEGYLHGEVIYYYPGGTPREKSIFEYEICTEEFSWDEAGNLTHHQLLPLQNYQKAVLERLRKKANERSE